MNKTHEKRRRDIKSKLMAAICMLLVSSIMMVSSTYAWFTLSTAPEVTGINTAVGANGNLEIALLPKTGGTNAITSGTGDSMLAIEQKNVTWGNLVDLSDSAVYGLDKITLYPAALNVDPATSYDTETSYLKTFGSIMLQTPSYGSDGRVATLNANTTNGYYNATSGNFLPNEEMGVRAVGTASGMTNRQLAYRNARSAASTAASQAKSVASNSLNNNGSTLANVAIKKGTGQTEFTLADLNSMKAIVDDLLGTDTKTGALEYVDRAYMQYILAYAASAAGPADAETEAATAWKLVEGLVNAENATLKTVNDGLSGAGARLPDGMDVIYNSLYAEASGTDYTNAGTWTKVKSAQTTLDSLIAENKASYSWSEISGVLYLLANPDNLEVNGIKAGEIMQDNNMSALVNSVAGNGLMVSMKSGGGVYADIADHCGDYTASVVIEKVSYNGLELNNMTAKMETISVNKPNYSLTRISTAIEAAGAPAGSAANDQPITDMFGYVIDLAFRTNAADSSLILQRDAIDRIYSGNANEGTMGHGSNMTFGVTSAELTETQIKGLMDAIRIVFFTPGANSTDSNTVVMLAKLDGTGATKNEAGEWVAQLKLYKQKKTAGTEDTYEETADTTADPQKTYYTRSGDETNGYTYTPVTGELQAGTTYYTKTAGAAAGVTEEEVTDDIIMPLTQNTAHQLSVLVYLDGNYVGNDDVAAKAATSMVGQLNLQFASTAALVPMEYSALHTRDTQAKTYAVSLPQGVTGNDTATANTAYTFTVPTGSTLGTVTVAGATVVPEGGTDGVYTIPAASVIGDIVITLAA